MTSQEVFTLKICSAARIRVSLRIFFEFLIASPPCQPCFVSLYDVGVSKAKPRHRYKLGGAFGRSMELSCLYEVSF